MSTGDTSTANMRTADLTPVTVIGGYLGAGKTTLINHLLSADHGLRLAVLVNDFGAINIDAALIRSLDGNVLSMENGCVCCSIADALGDGLDEVLALIPRPDQIIIEASGVADPKKIAAYGAGWPGCRLDAVVVLVDVEAIGIRQNDQFVGELVSRQLRSADFILLTKCDLVSAEHINQVRHDLKMKTTAPILKIGGIPVDYTAILDGRWTNRPTDGSGDAETSPQKAIPTPNTIAASDDLFESLSITIPEPVGLQDFEGALAALPDDVVRLKGVVSTVDGAGVVTTVIVQRVGRRLSFEPAPTDLQVSDVHRTGAPSAGILVAIAPRGQMPTEALAALGSQIASASR